MIVTAIIALFLCVGPGCVAPEAIKTDIQGIRTDMKRLEKVVEQKANNTTVAKHVEGIHNSIEQVTQVAEQLSLWRKSVQADTINYGGGGWIVLGTSVMAVIFIGSGLLLVRAFMKRGNLLTVLTRTVQKVGESSPEAVHAIKKQLKIEVSNGGPFTEQDRKSLGHFATKRGTFSNG